MRVRIYKPAQSAMQSGRGRSRRWMVEFEPQAPKRTDSLMGWVGSADTAYQVGLSFDSKEGAIAYAKRHSHVFTIVEPHERVHIKKSYAANFGTS
ncbi:NADH-ubiquinone oxidoreductase-related protein [invertebrate metagenome]|uniref:NADH-ubiquinone oxidoreductase-related protein n=1 Tax=invertebrate metagenome TaxID=1711999 RepID=A0A484H6I8_9ZZZZ